MPAQAHSGQRDARSIPDVHGEETIEASGVFAAGGGLGNCRPEGAGRARIRGGRARAGPARGAGGGAGAGRGDRVRGGTRTHLPFMEQWPVLHRVVVRRSCTDRPLPQDPVTTNAALISGALATIFADQLRSLGLDSGGAQTWAHAGVGLVQAAGDWWLQDRTPSPEQLRDYMLMMAWGSLDAILQAGGSPARMFASQPPTEKPTRRLSAGPISM